MSAGKDSAGGIVNIFSKGTEDWLPSIEEDSKGLLGTLDGCRELPKPCGGGGSGSLSNGLKVGAAGGGGGGGISRLPSCMPGFWFSSMSSEPLNGLKVGGGGAGGGGVIVSA